MQDDPRLTQAETEERVQFIKCCQLAELDKAKKDLKEIKFLASFLVMSNLILVACLFIAL